MMRGVLIAALSIACSGVQADEWTGRDKTLHAIGGAGIGAASTLVFKDARYGCAAAAAVGALKEVYDARHRDKHTPSFKDFAVTAVAGCAASYSTEWLFVVPKQGGAEVVWSKRF